MTKTYSRRSFLKGILSLSFAGLLTAAGGYSYARFIEPSLLDITPITFTHPKIPAGFNGLKIVQFSDTHLSEFYPLSRLEKIVAKINDLGPDLLIFTGDLIDKPNQYRAYKQVAPVLRTLSASVGKFAIYGNHDHGGYGTDIYKDIMEESGFNLLKNEVKRITLRDGSMIQIAGIDDLMLGLPNYEKTLGKLNEGLFSILLAHEPDAAIQSKHYPVDLQLSGHSHGGQIQLPFYGPLITPPFASVYTEGMYDVNQMKVYVNRGLGMTRLPFRFFCKPEITVFTLQKGKN
ncbi:metallophosphoesterase [Metabacillus fastidiosus]|uniref:metallophosphoesterase n=1 Tax=Metabacillus fastidiosus TaxID=1458 RepID=UPI003D2835F1